MDLWEGSQIFISNFLCVLFTVDYFLEFRSTISQVVSQMHAYHLYRASFALLCPSSDCQTCYVQIFTANHLFLSFFSFSPPCIKWHKRVVICSGEMNTLPAGCNAQTSSLMDSSRKACSQTELFHPATVTEEEEPGTFNSSEQTCGAFFQRIRWCTRSKNISLAFKICPSSLQRDNVLLYFR